MADDLAHEPQKKPLGGTTAGHRSDAAYHTDPFGSTIHRLMGHRPRKAMATVLGERPNGVPERAAPAGSSASPNLCRSGTVAKSRSLRRQSV